MAKREFNVDPKKREFVVKGLSAHPDWWTDVESACKQMSVNRSAFIRLAVADYLKGSGLLSEQPEMVTAQ